MPNDCSGSILVEGEPKEIRRFLKHMKTKKHEFDFNRIISTKEDIAKQRGAWKKLSAEEKKRWTDFTSFWYNKSGHNWCWDNWGTKWNAYEVDIEDWKIKDGYVNIHFCTAWSPCNPVVKKIIQDFPELEFEYHFEESGCCFAGNVHGKNGKVTLDETYDFETADCILCESFSIKERNQRKYRCCDCGHKFTQKEYDEWDEKR